ncbi:Cyclin-T1-4 [Dactylella cylindrospora]|nr:Cyclin-T1-4 [Dactylella cylindrospora]
MAHRDDQLSSTSRSHDDAISSPGATNSGRRRVHPHLVSKNAVSFMALMGDILRLQEESLAMAYLYMHKYRKFIRDSNDRSSESIPDFLDPHTLALTCLSLSTKSTESPRRLRNLILPAYSLLHPTSPPLPIPSHLYDTLRATLVTSELHLLRILKFELRLPIPHDYLPRMLYLSISVIPGEEYGDYGTEKQAEDKIAGITDTSLGRQCVSLATRCVAVYSIATFYDAKTIAAGVLSVVLRGNGIRPGEGEERWLEMVSGGSMGGSGGGSSGGRRGDVEIEDFRDVVKEVLAVAEGEGSVRVQEIAVGEYSGEVVVGEEVEGGRR